MIPVLISGLGQCSALGFGLDRLRQAWLDGGRPEATAQSVETSVGPREALIYRVPQVVLPPKLVPEAVERRMSRFAKMAFASVQEALTDAGPARAGDRTGLIVGSAYGCLDVAITYQNRIFQSGAAGASPTLFASSIHNSLASQLTLAFDMRGPNSTIATMEQTTVAAFRLAFDWIQQDVVDRTVVVLGDELTPYHVYAHALDGGSPLGEGMAAFVLDKEPLAEKGYARLAPPQLANDAPPSGTIFGASAHAEFYGEMVMSLAFETLLAALHVEREGETYSCVQDSPGLARQSLTLTGVNV